MDLVWHGLFYAQFEPFFQRFGHIWMLVPTLVPPEFPPKNQWYVHTDTAKVRFCCPDCNNRWSSMKGQITFWFRIDYSCGQGFVWFKLYGQQCKCGDDTNSRVYEHAIWYSEEVLKVCLVLYKNWHQNKNKLEG